MQSLSHRQCRCLSSLLTVSHLERRTLGFSKFALRVTKDPIWKLVPMLRDGDRREDVVRGVLQHSEVTSREWYRWCSVIWSPTFEHALDLFHFKRAKYRQTPSWVVLALASHKVKSPSDARSALYDLAFPLTSDPSPIDEPYALPLFILVTHSIAYFSLASLLPPLTSRFIDLPPSHTHPSFYFNMLLQAISLSDRSRVAADVAVEVLREMRLRNLVLWQDTENVLLRDNFRSPQLLHYFHHRRSTPAGMDNLEARLRAYASFGDVQSSAHILDTIRKQCLKDGITPPYPTEDDIITDEQDVGMAHKANTQYLRSMQFDRQSAFRHFHHLLKLDHSNSRQSPSSPTHLNENNKSSIDIYDWTTVLHAGARDRTLSGSSLLDLFNSTKESTSAYKPTRATYIVLMQGLLWRNALDEAETLWDEFISEVVDTRKRGNTDNRIRIDRKALCVGIDILVRSKRSEEALCLLEEAIQRDIEQARASSSSQSRPTRTLTSPYLKVHPIHVLFSSLLRIRRPDAIFYIWTHLTSLYFVSPTNLMLRILLKAAIQAFKMDRRNPRGAMTWYFADTPFKRQSGPIAPHNTTEFSGQQDHEGDASPSLAGTEAGASPVRDALVARLTSLLQSPTPTVVGIWANQRSTEVARRIFRGMIFGNWPALGRASGSLGGVTPARAKGGDSLLQELARVFSPDPGHFLPRPVCLSTEPPTTAQENNERGLGPPLPTVVPTESTFAAYIALLGLSSCAHEIPEVFGWMRALDVVPKTETLAVGLVFWMQVGLRGPLFEDGWGTRPDRVDASPRTEYQALRAWIRDWVGTRAPTEYDIEAGVRRVRAMRDDRFDRRTMWDE